MEQPAPPPKAETAHRLSAFRIFSYVLPNLPLAALGLPIVVHLPRFYASRQMGLSLATTGLVFSLCRIADVFVDPVMGYISDRLHTPFGRRRPMVLLGTPILALGIWMVFVPGGPVSPLHLSLWLFLMYLGWSMVTIPHLSWGAELSSDYHERSRIYGWAQVTIILGMVGVLIIPALLEHAGGYPLATQVLAMACFALVFLVPAIFLVVGVVPEPPVLLKTHAPLLKTLRFLLFDGALRRVILADLLVSTSAGALGAMFFYFADFALRLRVWAGTLLLAYFVSGIVFIPAWMWLARRIGKDRTLRLSFAYTFVTVPLYLLVPAGRLLPALAIIVLSGANYGAPTFLLRAMMADVADLDTAHHGAERAGVMYSLLALTNKFGLGWAVGISFAILAWLGFDPKLHNSPLAIEHMRIFFILCPVVLSFANLLQLAGYPLDEASQRVTRSRVEQQRLRQAGHDGARSEEPPESR